RLCDPKHLNGPFAGNQRFIVRAGDDLRALIDRQLDQLRSSTRPRRQARCWVTQRLRRDPVLAIPTVVIAAEHPEAERQGPRLRMEEGFLLDWIALQGCYVPAGHVQRAFTIEPNLANADLALRQVAAMATRDTAHGVVCERYAELFPFGGLLRQN